MLWLKVLAFVLLVPGTVLVAIPLSLGSLESTSLLPGFLQLLAWPLWALGGALLLYCVLEFARRGRGTPAPMDAPKRLVVTGLYRHVRNPMYVAAVLVLIGHALYFGTLPLGLYLLGVWLAFHLFIVLYEEPALARRFGEDYLAYRRSVPRWRPLLKPASLEPAPLKLASPRRPLE